MMSGCGARGGGISLDIGIGTLVVLSVSCLTSLGAFAAEWTQTVGLNTSVVYTDNTSLSENQEDDEMSLLISPSVSIKGDGARVNLDLAASLQLDSRGKGSDSTNPRLRANADAELVEDLFFVDLESTITQNAIDPYSPVGSDALNDTGNVTTTYTYGLSPYLVGRFKGYANLLARYSYDEVSYSKNNLDSSIRHDFSLRLNSGPHFGHFSWGISANHNETEYDNNNSTEFRTANIDVGYQVNRAWKITASVGREWNEYTSIQSETEGDRWDLGVVWTPSPRTSLDFRVGNRFFGETAALNLTHKSKRSVLTASFSQDLTDRRSLRDDDIFRSTDVFGYAIDPITGEIFPVGTLAAINDSTFVNKRFDASYTLQGRRTSLTIKANHSQQTYQDSTTDSEQSSIGFSATRSLSGKLNANADLTLRTQSQNSGNDADTVSIGVGVDHKLGQNSSFGLKYGFSDRDSDQSGASYTENRITASLNAKF
ncbi:MAG: TIGR03016 family PEP-CTERM system-associated outer membrane protein [Sedimenticola sp.]